MNPEDVVSAASPLHPACKAKGCYMFADGTRERVRCVTDCRRLKPQPKVTRTGLMIASTVGMAVGMGMNVDEALEVFGKL